MKLFRFLYRTVFIVRFFSRNDLKAFRYGFLRIPFVIADDAVPHGVKAFRSESRDHLLRYESYMYTRRTALFSNRIIEEKLFEFHLSPRLEDGFVYGPDILFQPFVRCFYGPCGCVYL